MGRLVGLAVLLAGCASAHGAAVVALPAPASATPSPGSPPPEEPSVQTVASVRCSAGEGSIGESAPSFEPPALVHREAEPVAANLRAWVALLADPSLRGRAAGSAEARRVAALLAAQLAASGWESALPGGDFCQPFERRGVRDQNVVARLLPAGPPARYVLLGAHYDHLGAPDGVVHPGADDNASGVAALLEVARVLGQRAQRPAPDDAPAKDTAFLLVFFGAEEPGLLGSRHFVEHPAVPLEQVRLMVNLDMVGRPLLDGQAARLVLREPDISIGYVVSERGRAEVVGLVEEASRRTGTHVVGLPEWVLLRAGFSADSVPFSGSVPTLLLSTSLHDDYHRPTDTADRIDEGQMKRAADLVLSLLGAVSAGGALARPLGQVESGGLSGSLAVVPWAAAPSPAPSSR